MAQPEQRLTIPCCPVGRIDSPLLFDRHRGSLRRGGRFDLELVFGLALPESTDEVRLS